MELLAKRVADPKVASTGRQAYQWARSHMPALTRTVEKLSQRRPLEGRKVGACLHVTKETSVLVKGLIELGADVSLAAANPLTTQDDIAAFLLEEGASVWAWRGEIQQEYFDCIRTVLRSRPEVQVDDGADAHVLAHRENLSGVIVGGTEETTTGVTRLMALEKEGRLRYPIIAVNNAQTKFLFDNRYGTGQSTLDGVLRATSLLIAGKTVVISGYGWVGKGIARRARGLDAHVIVTEVDPVRALEAHMDGFEVMPLIEAARKGDLFITATGQTKVIGEEHIKVMKDNAVLANAGHFDVEIDVEYLRTAATQTTNPRPNLDGFVMADGRKVYLIGKGRVANLVAAEGHPPEVMSMSFSNQLLSVLYIVENHDKLEKKVIDVPTEIDRQVALNMLEASVISIDKLTEEQLKYGRSWEV